MNQDQDDRLYQDDRLCKRLPVDILGCELRVYRRRVHMQEG